MYCHQETIEFYFLQCFWVNYSATPTRVSSESEVTGYEEIREIRERSKQIGDERKNGRQERNWREERGDCADRSGVWSFIKHERQSRGEKCFDHHQTCQLHLNHLEPPGMKPTGHVAGKEPSIWMQRWLLRIMNQQSPLNRTTSINRASPHEWISLPFLWCCWICHLKQCVCVHNTLKSCSGWVTVSF